MTKDEALELALHTIANCRDFISFICELDTPPWNEIDQLYECQDAIRAIKDALRNEDD